MEVLILFIGILLGVSCLLIDRFYKKVNMRLVVRILVVVYVALFFVRMFLPDDFLLVINGANEYGRYIKTTDIYQSIIRWGYQCTLLTLPMAVFFPKNPYWKKIIAFIGLPMIILNIISFDKTMSYFSGKEIVLLRNYSTFNVNKFPYALRKIEYIVELIIALGLSVYSIIDKNVFKFTKKQILNLGLMIVPLIFLSLPVYVPQSLFGYGSFMLTGFTVQNYIWILLMIISMFIIYFIFRFQSYDNRYQLSVFLSLSVFILYNTFYMTGVTIPRLPIQLCNLACYLILIAVVFKLQKLFDFILIANVLGAIIAIMVPDLSYGIFSLFHFHFLYEHMLILMIPIILLSLRVFKRPDKKSLKHAYIGFAIYFSVCLISGTYLNSIQTKTGYSVNYFYIFKDEVIQVFSFLRFTRDFPVKIGDYTAYPLYQLSVFIMFSVGMYLLYKVIKWLENIGDDHFRLRQIRIKEKETRTGKKSNAVLEYVEEDSYVKN